MDLGYNARTGAWILSACFGFAAIGKIVLGLVADHTSGRFGMMLNFVGQAIGVLLALYLTNAIIVLPFVLSFGLTLGAPLMLVPVMIAESLGIKRYGSISGLISLASTVGAALGPIASGWIRDLTSSYVDAYLLFLVINILGGVAAISCLPYSRERTRVARAAVSA